MDKEKRYVHMYCGTGWGKSSAAIGRGIKAACAGKTVFVVQFLKGKAGSELDFIKRLEPEIKLFTFDKFEEQFAELSEEEKREEMMNIRNGLNFAKKVLVTSRVRCADSGRDSGTSSEGDYHPGRYYPLIEAVGDGVELIMTGIDRCEALCPTWTR